MGNLNNLYISQSFQSLAHLGTDTALVPGTMTQLQDGIGQSLNIFFDGTNISSSGNIYGANITQSVINTGSLATTASFNAYTQSTNIRLNNLESTTASLNSSVTQLNASSASQQVSINALNQFTASNSFSASIVQLNQFTSSANIRLNNLESTSASVNISINNLNSKTGSYATTGSNTFTGQNNFSASVEILGGLGIYNNPIFLGLPKQMGDPYDTNVGIFTPFVEAQTASGNELVLSGDRMSNKGVSIKNGLTVTGSLYVAPKPGMTPTPSDITASGNITAIGNFTASLQQGYVWVGNGSGITTAIATSSLVPNINTGSFATTGSNQFNGSQSISGSVTLSGSLNNVNYIDFNTASATPAWKSGRVFWDNTDGCLGVYNAEADITLNVGQENWTRVFNGTGTTITNGTAVRLSGTHGDVPEVVRAQSLAISGAANIVNQILGLATHNIETGTYGYITTQGLVRGLNTSAFTDGATLYVSQSAGLLTTTPPPTPFEKIPIGQCVKASPGASGIIYVAVEQPIDFSDLSSVTVGTYTNADMWIYEGTGVSGSWNHRQKDQIGLTTTSSFNAYTSSTNISINSLNAKTGSYLTTGSVSGSQTARGAFNFDMMYTSSFQATAVTSSTSYLYVDYSIFNEPQLQFWTTSDGNTFVNAGQVLISGSGVNNSILNFNLDYQDFGVGFPVTGSTTNGQSYTFSGPYYHDLTVTGSVTTTYAQQVIGLDGRKTVQDAQGVYALSADSSIQAGVSTDGGVYTGDNSNGNYIKLAATASQVIDNTGNPTSINAPQIAVTQDNSGSFTQISFQGNNNYTDGRITSHQHLAISGSRELLLPKGTNEQTATAVLNGGNPGSIVVSNGKVSSSSLIFLTKQTNNSTGNVRISSKGTGTFTITSTANGDNDTVAYLIINPTS